MKFLNGIILQMNAQNTCGDVNPCLYATLRNPVYMDLYNIRGKYDPHCTFPCAKVTPVGYEYNEKRAIFVIYIVNCSLEKEAL